MVPHLNKKVLIKFSKKKNWLIWRQIHWLIHTKNWWICVIPKKGRVDGELGSKNGMTTREDSSKKYGGLYNVFFNKTLGAAGARCIGL